jgi:hypothetical protein
LKIAARFLALGPLFGACIFVVASVFLSGAQASIYGFGYILIFAIPVAYIFFGPAAVITGLLVAIASYWPTRLPHLYLFAGVIGAATAVAVGVMIQLFKRLPPFPSKPLEWLAVVMVGLVGSIAGIACTWTAYGARGQADTQPELPGAAQ